ncbi:MAG: 30S ribosomal protein S13 [Candidatus Aenigmatarchaeota archaeon]|nr:MAG: 30S ribosomal protein S13 [Candidatus Aenigmarchaeota archaeon]
MGKEIQKIVRIGETNIDGNKGIARGIMSIKGVSFMFANAVSKVSGFENKKIGELSEDELKRLEDIILNPTKYGIPSWLLNRRRDMSTGEDKHLTASQLQLTTKLDINFMKKIKTYKGIRHALGLPVRGQRTRSSFRKGRTIGVKRKEKK